MGCNGSAPGKSGFDDSNLDSIPTEISPDIVKNNRCHGNFDNLSSYLGTISTDLSKQDAKEFPSDNLRACLILCNTYNPSTSKNECGPLNDAVLTAKSSERLGHKVYSLINPKSTEFLTWLRIVLSKTNKHLTLALCGFKRCHETNDELTEIYFTDKCIRIQTILQFISSYKRPQLVLNTLFDLASYEKFSSNLYNQQMTIDTHNARFFSVRSNQSQPIPGYLTFLFWREYRANTEATLSKIRDNMSSTASMFNISVELKCTDASDEDNPIFC